MKLSRNLVTVFIFLLINQLAFGQFDYLNELGVDREKLAKNLVVVGSSLGTPLYETDMNDDVFDKCRIYPMIDNLSFIDFYITNPTPELVLDLMNNLYEKLGKDNDGNKRPNEEIINSFMTSTEFGSAWNDKKNNSFLSISYNKETSKRIYYSGILVKFSSDFVPEEGNYKVAINPREVLQSIKEPTFRTTKWGMNKSEVITLEGEPSENIDGALFYNSKLVGGILGDIVYVFVNDALVRTKYNFKEDHSNKNEYLKDYAKIKNVLEEKYGEAYTDRNSWSKDLYKGDVQNYGMAVSVGHLIMQAGWLNLDTDILTSLSGDNFKISHIVQYSSNALSSLEKSKEKEELRGQF